MAGLSLDDRLSFTRAEAAVVTGYSQFTIDAAIRSGDLRETFPEVNGKKLRKGVVLRADLDAWLRGGQS